MKIRKLTGLLTALCILASYGTLGTVAAGADTLGSGSGGDSTEIIDPSEPTEITAFDKLFNGDFYNYLKAEVDRLTYEDSFYVDAETSNESDLFITYNDILDIRTFARNYDFTVEVKLKSLSGGYYTVFIDSGNINSLTKSELAVIEAKGGIDLSLNVIADNEKLFIRSRETAYNNIGVSLDYYISSELFEQYTSAAYLNTVNESIGMYNAFGEEELIRRDVVIDNAMEFSIGDSTRKGYYFKAIPDSDQICNPSEMRERVRMHIYEYLGFEDDTYKTATGYIEGIDSEFDNTRKYIEEVAIPDIMEVLDHWSYFDEIQAAADEYCYDNNSDFVEKLISDISISEQVKNELDELLGDDVPSDEKNSLYDLLSYLIMEDVEKEMDIFGSNLKTDITKTLNELVEKEVAAQTQTIKEDILKELEGSGADSTLEDIVKDILEDMGIKNGEDGIQGPQGEKGDKGDQGEKGETGADGQSFEEWMKQEYGSKEAFLNEISFKAWAEQQYGSVDNFISSISGQDGLSAYELARQEGYRGTLTDWLSDLQGEDGLSAYELAKENGFKGNLDEWLESLQGEDGEDGEDGDDGRDGDDGQDGQDGRDGADGQIIYVNGTYGKVEGTGAVTEDDVIFIPSTSSKPSAGNVNPATGVAAGIILPAAAIGSVLLVKKNKRRRGRK